MSAQAQIKEALAGLKDFQRATVEMAVGKLNNGQTRFLIADEVGLGKTIVAKGIIAKLVEERLEEKKMLHVVYICSNLALAKQNLAKLSFVKKDGKHDEDFKLVINSNHEDDRISALAYDEKIPKNKYGLYIRALTPATSFDIKTSSGKSDERILLYRILSEYKEFQKRHVSLKWLLIGSKSPHRWHNEIENIRNNKNENGLRKIRSKVFSLFKKELKNNLDPLKFKKTYQFLNLRKETSLWHILLQLLQENKQDRSFFHKNVQNQFVGKFREDFFGPDQNRIIAELRFRLSIVCKEFLQADLFVLDEFQRFSNLIKSVDENDDPGTFIAKSIFSNNNTKVLMLSATPFKAYTNQYDELQGENHFEEFKSVLSFLLQNYTEAQWKDLESLMMSFFTSFRKLDNTEEQLINLKELKKKIEKQYQTCMARTERSLVEQFSDKKFNNSLKPMAISREDIVDFLTTDEIVKKINEVSDKKLSLPVEYVKSAPFPFSFLQDYEHMKVFESVYKENKDLQKVVKNAKRAWLPIERIQQYKALLPETEKQLEPNAKLRLLYNETVRNKGWQLLWIPASIPYYKVKKGAYMNADSFSKTLIFSAWKMVPRMTSALVSYEVERLSVGKYIEKGNDEKIDNIYQNKKGLSPLLTYKVAENKLSGMNNLMLFYPSIYLSCLYDPEQNLVDKKDLSEIKRQLARKIKNQLLDLGMLNIGEKGGDKQKWDWYAILLLDKMTSNKEDLYWIQNFTKKNTEHVESEDEMKENGSKGRLLHYAEIEKCLLDPNYIPNVSRLTKSEVESLANQLADLAIGSPGISCYRALQKNYKETISETCFAAFIAAQGYNTLFNKPESIAIVNLFAEDKNYHSSVLNYCILGNIQSMIDEYVYQLKDSSNLSSSFECASLIRDVMSVVSTSIDVKYPNDKSNGKLDSFSIRTHYAIPFGTGSNTDLKVGNRQVKVRESFNSPFRPFVLTSTSIGQEGLDFHYYCSELIHWNLPTNPIDLEQREGRIKRFKGLNIRRALAQEFIGEIEPYDGIIWDEIYQKSIDNKPKNQCDLIPFWYVPNDEHNALKTLIPIYNYSKDHEKLRMIKTVLKNYRLTFGQPRQEELIEILSEKFDNQEINKLNKELFINLSPIDIHELNPQ